jgi:HEPN domain-containing protein
MQPGTDKLLAKAARALATAEAALDGGAADVAAGRAFHAILNAAKARLNEHGLRLRTHARVAAAYAALPPRDEAPAAWLDEALALRAHLAADPEGLDYAAVEALVERARRFVAATRAG